ncbi:MAG TPA: histidinol-phosphate transaminase [Chloroflexi bacterium]|nr:histidinol-phosphate transaminase [Chloroflexota bacterium]
MTVPPAQRSHIRPGIRSLSPYEPIESPQDLAKRLGMPLDHIVKLDANENPYGCSLRVQEALAEFDRYNVYPDAQARRTRERVATYAGVSADNIILSNGSDELLDMILLTTLEVGGEVIVPEPTYGLYRARVELFGGHIVQVPRTESFDLDIDAILAAVSDRTSLIVIANPNNPTGNLATTQQIVRLLHTGALVVVDEAYFEFCGKTIMPLTGEFDNLIVLRTFSTWAGLAGLRFGYGVFPRHISEQIWKVRLQHNVNIAALIAAEVSLDDVDYLYTTIERIRAERGRLIRQLRRQDLLAPCPSQANFLLCRVTRGDAHDIHLRLADRGVMIRSYRDPVLSGYLRISVGRPDDTTRLITALQNISTRI